MRSAAAFAAASGSGGERELGITVRVYDFSHLGQATLNTAEKRAAIIFRKAGVAMRWCNIPTESSEGHMDASCNQLADPAGLELRIVPQAKVMPKLTTDSTEGFALGNLATVSYQWIVDANSEGLARPGEILGCVIAHEIGHLLLGPNSHSRTGIMVGKWSPEALRDAGQGRLHFTPQQAERICAEVMARSGAQQASIATMAATQL